MSTTPELELDFERALGGIGPSDELLVFLAAETTTAEGPVSVKLGPTTVGLRALSDAVLAREPAVVLFFVEACHDGAADDPLLGAEHVPTPSCAPSTPRARGAGARSWASRPAARAVDGAVAVSRAACVYACKTPRPGTRPATLPSRAWSTASASVGSTTGRCRASRS